MSERMYTQEEYQRMATAQYAAGLSAAMGAVGFEPERGADFKAQVVAFGEYVEGKTGAEVERATAGEREKGMRVERKLMALERGIPAEKAERYTRLAATYEDGETEFEAALDRAVKEFPLDFGMSVGGPRIVASATGAQGARTWKEMTLRERAEVYRREPERARRLARESGEVLG